MNGSWGRKPSPAVECEKLQSMWSGVPESGALLHPPHSSQGTPSQGTPRIIFPLMLPIVNTQHQIDFLLKKYIFEFIDVKTNYKLPQNCIND